MLEPERRHLLLDALRPPVGFVFDTAVGTTFTLDLVALLVTPVAFALFDVEADDGTPLANPIAILEAVRRYAGRVSVYCQAGEIAAPAEYRGAFAYLEQTIIPVTAPRAGGIFHPKVWLVRFRRSDGARRYRLLCLSRNLTFDRSWDTIVRLDGEPTDDPEPRNEPLSAFIASLPAMAVGTIAPSRAALARELAEEVLSVRWDGLPDGLALERFWPLGHNGQSAWPFDGDVRRMLVVSPFVGPELVDRLFDPRRADVLVSRAETLDRLGLGITKQIRRTCVLQPTAVNGSTADAPSADHPQPGVDDGELEGLHAKLYVADAPWWSRIWTGSANATEQAFARNVEFLVELRGRNSVHGVGPLVDPGSPGQVRLANLLDDYLPALEPPGETDEEAALRSLDALARRLASLRWTAVVTPGSDDTFTIEVTGAGKDVPRLPRNVTAAIRPVTQGQAVSTPLTGFGKAMSSSFSTSFEGITAFFRIDLATRDGSAEVGKAFLVAADLLGAPENRLDRLLVSEIHNRSDLVRLLLLLLGSLDPSWGDLVDFMKGKPPIEWSLNASLGSEALLEPLLRALSRDPDRLDDIERLVTELVQTPEGRELLPEGWAALWEAVVATRPAKPMRALA